MTDPGADDLDPRLLELMSRFLAVTPEIVEVARAHAYNALATAVSRASSHGLTPAGVAAIYLVLAEHEDELGRVIASSTRLLAAFDAIETLGNRACRDRAVENRN